MNAHKTTAKAPRFDFLASLRNGAAKLSGILAGTSSLMASAREAERLMQLSDAELAARGLTRDGIVTHAFRGYMAS